MIHSAFGDRNSPLDQKRGFGDKDSVGAKGVSPRVAVSIPPVIGFETRKSRTGERHRSDISGPKGRN